jgi:hypothetical protein
MPDVLVIVNPGCDAKAQEDVRGPAWDLLYPHCHNQLRAGDHHHVCGTLYPWSWGHFSRCSHISDFDDDDLPTVRPLSHPPSYPDGNTCLGCNGTGQIPFACARNTCPLCGGAGVQLDDDLDPGIFPIPLISPEYIPWAIVTPDGHWHCCESFSDWSAWQSHVQEVASYFRHCYGVCMRVK